MWAIAPCKEFGFGPIPRPCRAMSTYAPSRPRARTAEDYAWIADGRLRLHDDQAGLGHLPHGVVRAFTGVAGVAHAAVGHLVGAVRRDLVDEDAAEVELARGAQRGREVGGEDRRLEPVA